MYEQLYRIEVNVICLLILFWIIFRLRLFADKQTRNILFSRVIVENFLLIFLDTLMVFFSGKTSPFFYTLNWLFNLLYLILNACTAYSWFSYVIYTLFENKKRISVVNKFCAIPLVIFIFMSVVSIFTKWIFFIDSATGSFVNGKLYFLQIIFVYGFFTCASVISLIFLIQRKQTLYRPYVIVIAFILLPFLGGFFHIIFPQAKLVWQMLSLGFLLIYVEIQFDLISRDALTGLNNRRAFDSQLEKISEYGLTESDGKAYHIFMMDINLFKEINDTYGHIEGDNALVVVAKIISKHFENTNAFKCRYGGDEFAIIYWCTSDEAGKILKEIYNDFENSSQSYNLEYKLSVSIGYAAINGRGLESAKKALKLADSNLYVEKDFMHKKLNR